MKLIFDKKILTKHVTSIHGNIKQSCQRVDKDGQRPNQTQPGSNQFLSSPSARPTCAATGQMSMSTACSLGCNEFIFYSIFIWLTLFSLYFSILRTICFLTFFDSRPPSFAKLTFCRFKFSKEAVGTKFGYFLSEYFLGTNCMPL